MIKTARCSARTRMTASLLTLSFSVCIQTNSESWRDFRLSRLQRSRATLFIYSAYRRAISNFRISTCRRVANHNSFTASSSHFLCSRFSIQALSSNFSFSALFALSHKMFYVISILWFSFVMCAHTNKLHMIPKETSSSATRKEMNAG